MYVLCLAMTFKKKNLNMLLEKHEICPMFEKEQRINGRYLCQIFPKIQTSWESIFLRWAFNIWTHLEWKKFV